MSEIGLAIKNRLCTFIEHKRLTNAAFEKKCGLSNGYIRNFKGNLGGKKLEDILTSFPQLNKEWLLFGNGPMLKNGDVSSQTPAPSQEEPQERNSMLDSILSLVESQRKDIETLIQLTKEKDNRIERLTQELLDAQQENNTLRLDLLMLTPNEKESVTGAEDSLSASAI